MAHDEHHTPGELPPVRDEAADSPLWLPAVGLTLLLLGALFLVWRGSAAEDVGGLEGAEAAEEADGDAPAENTPAENAEDGEE